MKLPRSKTAALKLLTVLALGGLIGMAAPVTGIVNLSGTASVGGLTIDFYSGAGCNTPGPADGCFLTNFPTTGSFSGLLPLVVGGSIKDLSGPPITGNISVLSWMSFVNGVTFDLTRVEPGGAPDCGSVNTAGGGVSCTPMIGPFTSPFTLTNTALGNSSFVQFSVEVNAWTGSRATGVTPYTGIFTTQSAGRNIKDILDDIASGKVVENAYSANFSPVPQANVPEPETKALFGLGLGAILIGALRRKASNRA